MALIPGESLSVGSFSTEFSANDEGALDYIIANQIEVNTNQDIDFIVGGMIGKRVPSQIN